jgi:phage shock protein A
MMGRGNMGLLRRISDLLKSNISDLVSKAEDPQKLLDVAIEDMQRQLAEAKSRVAVAIADEKRLEKQLETTQTKATDWEKKAMAAVRAGRDDLAMEALAKKKEQDASALQFEQQLSGQGAAVEELKKALNQLSQKIDETKRKRTLLVARVKRAEAQKHIAETLSITGDRSALDKVSRMEEKVDRIEAEAEAQWEIASLSSGSHDRDLEDQIKQLESGSTDDELLALKERMRVAGTLSSGAKGELPAKAGEERKPQEAAPAEET